MSDFVPLLKHNPSAQDPEVLEAITVQREPLIASLVECVLDTDGGLRHQLIVGPRGMGKTHILSLVVSRVRADRSADDIVIAWLDEDPWPIRSYDKFLAAIIAGVAEEVGDSGLMQRALELRSGGGAGSLEGEEELRHALADRRLVLLVENLDEVFRRIGKDGQAKFRAFAEDWRQMLILATSPQLFEGVRDHASPFYGFFAITHLDELSFESAVELMKRIAELHEDSGLRDYLETEVAMQRLATVEALAGGHPRIWMLFAGCISIEAIDELVPLFLEALDDLTPYYQDRLRELSDQQQEIVVLLSEAGGALSNRALAERSGISQNQIATMLRHLTDRGYIRPAEVPGDLAVGDARMSYWELREPLMRLCLDVKQARGAPLRMIVEFLRAWYGSKLLDELTRLPPEAQLATTYAGEAFRTLEERISADDLYRGSPKEILARAEAGLSWRPDGRELQAARAAGLMLSERYEEGKDAIERLLESEGEDPFLRVQLLDARRNLGEVSEPEFATDLEEALSANREDSSVVTAIAYAYEQGDARALAAFTRAAELQPGRAELHYGRCELLRGLGRFEEALEAIDRASELEPAEPLFHIERSRILELLSRPEEALDAFSQGLALDPGEATLHLAFGRMLADRGRHAEALDAFETAVELKPKDGLVHGVLGMGLYALGRLDQSIDALRRSVELNPSDVLAQNALGVILAQSGRPDEALGAFTRAIEIAPENPEPFSLRAGLLRSLGRLDEAEWSARKAIEVEPDSAAFRFLLAEILLGTGDSAGSLVVLKEAFEKLDGDLDLPGDTELLCRILWDSFAPGPERRTLLAGVLDIYATAGAAEDLGRGLVTSIPLFLADGVGLDRAEAWFEDWLAAPAGSELEIPLNLLRAALGWKRDQDRAHLLGLPAEQREILIPLLKVDAVSAPEES